jgi:hypothetical protein
MAFVTIGSLVLFVIIENQIFLINSCFDLAISIALGIVLERRMYHPRFKKSEI